MKRPNVQTLGNAGEAKKELQQLQSWYLPKISFFNNLQMLLLDLSPNFFVMNKEVYSQVQCQISIGSRVYTFVGNE